MDFCNASNASTDSGRCSPVAGATIVSPTLMFLAGVLGNIFAIWTLYHKRTDVRTTKFYTLVAALAWTDLAGILMTSPSTFAAYVNGRRWMGGDAHCRFHGFAMTCFGLATPLIICAMAVERFLALKCVFFYSSRCKHGSARGVVVALWIAVLWYGILPLFGFGRFEKQYPGTWCFLDFHSTNATYNAYGYIYATVNLLLIVLMTLCNGYVVFMLISARILRKSDPLSRASLVSIDSGNKSRLLRRKQGQMEVQMIVLTCAITTIFAVCWAPLMIQIIVTMASGKSNFLLDLAAVRMASLNQTLDPWLYILLRRSFCKKIKSTSKVICYKCFPADDASEGCESDKVARNINLKPCEHVPVLLVVNEERVNRQVNGQVPAISSLPDVTMEAMGGQVNQLPDVTDNSIPQTQCPEYVCKVEIRNNHTNPDLPGDGIYVKFLFVPKTSDDESQTSPTPRKLSDSDNKFKISRTMSCASDGNNKQQDTAAPLLPSTNSQTVGSSGIFTKETSLLSGPETYHSQVVPENTPAVDHDSLRRTKSHT